jgi:DNA-binding transcriptional LysR family regulator
LPEDDTSRIGASRSRTTDYLRIAAPASVVHTLIAPALPRFLEQHPSMRIQFVLADRAERLDQCDAAVSIGPLYSHPSSHAHRLGTVPHVLCASEDFLAVRGTPGDPHELDAADCIGILDEDLKPRRWALHRDSTEVTIAPAAPLMFGDEQSAVLTAVRGGGMILVSSLAAEAQIAAGLLTPLLPEWRAPVSAVWMHHTGALTGQLAKFADFLAGLFPSEL